MIKATELRVGTFVGDMGNIPYKATPQTILGLWQCEIAGRIPVDVNPIPITEEWLLKLGFKIKSSWDNGERSGIDYSLGVDEFDFEYSLTHTPSLEIFTEAIVKHYAKGGVTRDEALHYCKNSIKNHKEGTVISFTLEANGGYDDNGQMDLINKIKYIHQLQNLFFALTGKELEIKND
jgi:hypothetical protein